ncbi:hypothetical protein IWW55_005939, partial [Coemansia sp. RSA 2706]
MDALGFAVINYNLSFSKWLMLTQETDISAVELTINGNSIGLGQTLESYVGHVINVTYDKNGQRKTAQVEVID